jgi:hypothetical protein
MSIQYRPVATTLLTLPAKKPANAYNISSGHFASCARIVDAAPRRPCSMSAQRKDLLLGLACLVLREAQAVGGRVPLAAEHEKDLRHQLMRDR